MKYTFFLLFLLVISLIKGQSYKTTDNWYKTYLTDLGLGIDEHKSELSSFDFSSVLLKTH